MERFDIYEDIASRTGGDLFIGVVGPVRTGKSTFIRNFMEKLVIPNINNKLSKQIAVDELPQSADGKTIMTTQPKFVPNESVKIQLKNKISANVRLVDCVGYLVNGAFGHEEEDKPRLVKTPWSEKEIPFEKAAEIGTRKVITDYSTIGVMITTDGTIGEIDRSAYEKVEGKVIKELTQTGKPFTVILNSKEPNSNNCNKLAEELSNKYGVSVIPMDVQGLTEQDVARLMESILYEFPMSSVDVDIPDWICALPADNSILSSIIEEIKQSSSNVSKMRDYYLIDNTFDSNESFYPMELAELELGSGKSIFKIRPKENLFYKVLSEECNENISNDYELIKYLKEFSINKRKFEKIRMALDQAEENGYGVVVPSIDDMILEEPSVFKQGGKYGVKIRAKAPSLHIMKVDLQSEVSPIVGTESQGNDMINYIMDKYKESPEGIWETNMFGKTLFDMMDEGLKSKVDAMPIDARNKMRKTVTRIVNENRGGVICILL